MLQTSAYTLAFSRYKATGTATAAVLLGAGMACAGTAHAGEQPLPDALDAASVPAPAALAARDTKEDNPLVASRNGMSGWKPVTAERLDELRGGFDVGDLQVSFGIERAVYLNGALVVATSINIPDVARISTDQATKLATTLGPAIVNSTQAGVASALGGNSGNSGSTGTSAASGSGAGANGAAGTAAAAAANGGAATSAGANGLASTVISTPTGQVITNGLSTVIQNGPGNAAAVGTMAATPMTVIQNTLNNQSIRSLMTIDTSVNTLQAFRSQLANTALNNALLRAASMR